MSDPLFDKATLLARELDLPIAPRVLALLGEAQLNNLMISLRKQVGRLIAREGGRKCEIKVEEPISPNGRLRITSATAGHPCVANAICVKKVSGGVILILPGTPGSAFDFQNPGMHSAFCQPHGSNLCDIRHEPGRGLIIELANLTPACLQEAQWIVSNALASAMPHEFSELAPFRLILACDPPVVEEAPAPPSAVRPRDFLPDCLSEVQLNDLPDMQQVIGHDTVKQSLAVAAKKFAYPDLAEQMGLTQSHILLHGPPGNGKTMLAKALAKEVSQLGRSVRLFLFDMNALGAKFHGQTEERTRKVLEFLRKNRPYVALLDEMDGGMQDRGQISSGNGVDEKQLAIVLSYLSGVNSEASADELWIGTTNRIESIDPAALRPGRFTQLLSVPQLNAEELCALARLHIDKLQKSGMIRYSCDGSIIRDMMSTVSGNWCGADVAEYFNTVREYFFLKLVADKSANCELTNQVAAECFATYQSARPPKYKPIAEGNPSESGSDESK